MHWSRSYFWLSISALFGIFLYVVLSLGFGRDTVLRVFHNRLFSGSQTFEVLINESGFNPKKIQVFPGDTVRFVNTSNSPVWPASDPHPTHTTLSALDTKGPLAPGEAWSFAPSSVGMWRFHDHLHVTSQGILEVLGTPLFSKNDATCGECFDELIRETVEKEGIDAAYALFKKNFEKNELPRACHWTAHQIGEAAYDLYTRGEDVPISDATSYCGYGFYHGFLESLLRENPDARAALQFCEIVEKKLGKMGLWNCYHGIGHGYTEDPPPPETEGDFEAIIAPGIKMCEYLFGKDFTNLNLCLTGVFTVPTGFAADNTHGLSIDPNNVFKYCKNQPYRYKKACYGEFAAKLDTILEWDITRLPPIVNTLADPKLQRLVTWVVPSVVVAKDILKDDHSHYISDCRESFQGRLRTICWGAVMLGFFQHGEPEKQYVPLLAFCRSKEWLNEEERTFCWGEAFRQMRQNYTEAKVAGICLMAPEMYHSLCLDTSNVHTSPYDDPSFN